MTAVAVEKCLYSTFWSDVYIQISEYKQVNICYENSENLAISKKERESINQNQL